MPYIIKGRALSVSLIAIVLAAVLGLVIAKLLPSPTAPAVNFQQAGIIQFPKARQLPAISLQGSDGQTYQADQFKGKWHLVFFGYTFCPDICPTTLAELKRIKSQLPPEIQAQIQILMISVDPDRDTPEQLKAYLHYFDPSFLGLTGAIEDIQLLSNATSIPFIPGDTSKPHYTVDHSGNLALINPQGEQLGVIRAPLNISGLVESLPHLID